MTASVSGLTGGENSIETAYGVASFEITAATIGVGAGLTGTSDTIDSTSASASVISTGGLSGTADLRSTGAKSVTLTDGTNTFDIDFNVTTGLANGDDFEIAANGLGALAFVDVDADADAETSTESSFT